MGFNDSTWSAASQHGPYGSGPWYSNVSGFLNSSSANWVWTADNNNDDTAYFRYTFTVGSAPLVMSTNTLPNGVVGTAYSQSLSATGGTEPYSWSITSDSLPAGISLIPTSGVLSGIPNVAATSVFTVGVMDANGATADRVVSLTISNQPPATLDLVIATDNANEVYLNGVLLGSASNWAQSNNYNAALQNGPNVLAVKGIDHGGPAGLIAELTLPNGRMVSDASWKVSTTAPAGWEAFGFDDSSWSAATSYGQYGVANWYTNVSGFPNGSTAKWIWSADNNNDDIVYFRYTFTVGNAPALTIETSTISNGVASMAYSQSLAATGGTPPYSWSIIAGNLPVGLSFSSAGLISGTPTSSGVSNFTVRVTDGINTVDRNFALSITSAPPATLGLVIATDNANEVYLNGVLLGNASNWFQSSNYNVALQNGTNVLAVKGIDTEGTAGLIAELTFPSGKLVSDASWKVSPTAPVGWEAVGFNDSTWSAATPYGAYGSMPWGKGVSGFPNSSTAKWIWTADQNNDNTAYFRYTFTLGSVLPPNVVPTVAITSPQNGSSYTGPTNITFAATATDSDGNITAVEFYSGPTLIGSVTNSPYTFTWNNVPLGSYSIRARAIDDRGDATYSSTISMNIAGTGPPANVYYLYPDHLNTPRVITDTSNTVVWRWDSDPFGTNAANEDPDGDGRKFVYNPRFPGQYFDRETGLHYNYFRSSYDPGTGRYGEADPIGIAGGLNVYGYANQNPMSFTDPTGLTSLVFDVEKGVLTVDPEVLGRKPYDINVTSGKGKCENKPKCEQMPDKGPIPRGNYEIYPSRIDNPSLMNDLRRNFRDERSQGGGDWGDWRVRIYPMPGTNRFGRTGFYLHGGWWDGSAGCIDIGGGIFGNDKLLRDLQRDPNDRIPLLVR